MTVPFANDSTLRKMRADLLVLPPKSQEAKVLRRAILNEEYRIDGFNCWVAGVNNKRKTKKV